MIIISVLVVTSFAFATTPRAADIQAVGVTVASLGNPYFVATDRGIKVQATRLTPHAKLTFVSADYDLGKQSTQIDNFIAAGAQIVMVDAADPDAIAPAVRHARAAGIIVGAFDGLAKGANFTIMTDNVAAGKDACQYIVDHLPSDKGSVVILNGPQVSPIKDRVTGCKAIFAEHPGINLLSSDGNAQASRDGGLSVGQDILARYQHLDAVFAVNDQSAIGLALAARQLHRNDFIITTVDGSPDIVRELKDRSSPVRASAAQDPARMAYIAYGMAVDLVNGRKLDHDLVLLPPKLVTTENVGDYAGWDDPSLGSK